MWIQIMKGLSVVRRPLHSIIALFSPKPFAVIVCYRKFNLLPPAFKGINNCLIESRKFPEYIRQNFQLKITRRNNNGSFLMSRTL